MKLIITKTYRLHDLIYYHINQFSTIRSKIIIVKVIGILLPTFPRLDQAF